MQDAESTSQRKFAVIINTASYERVAFGLGIVSALAALGKDVAVIFGYGALVRLKKDFEDEIGEETNLWIREQIKSALKKGGIPKISETLKIICKFKGKVYACPAAMTLHNLTKEDLIEEAEVRGVVEFLRDDAKGTQIIYI
jgi:peroxiredoxin family protein